MARRRVARLVVVDPVAVAVREGHVRARDAHVAVWGTAESRAVWAAERALWVSGEPMVCSTREVFAALTAAGAREAERFVHRNDRDGSRWWLVPGAEGGSLREVCWDTAVAGWQPVNGE